MRLMRTASFQAQRTTGSAVPFDIPCNCNNSPGRSLGACSVSITIQAKPAPAIMSEAILLQRPLHRPTWNCLSRRRTLNKLGGREAEMEDISYSTATADRESQRNRPDPIVCTRQSSYSIWDLAGNDSPVVTETARPA